MWTRNIKHKPYYNRVPLPVLSHLFFIGPQPTMLPTGFFFPFCHSIFFVRNWAKASQLTDYSQCEWNGHARSVFIQTQAKQSKTLSLMVLHAKANSRGINKKLYEKSAARTAQWQYRTTATTRVRKDKMSEKHKINLHRICIGVSTNNCIGL